MKNLFKMIGIVSLAAIIGFSFIACNPDDNNNNNNNNNNNPKATVAAKFKFRNAATNAAMQASQSLQIARSVTGPGGKTYEVDNESFADYDWFYNTWLGGDTKKIGTGITPTKFEIPVTYLRLLGNGIEAELMGTQYGVQAPDIVDFAQGVTIELGDIEPGTYNIVDFRFLPNKVNIGGSLYYPKVSFPLPAAMNDKVSAWPFILMPYTGNTDDPPVTHATNSGITTITANLFLLNPVSVEPATSGGGEYQPRLNPFDHSFSALYFYSNTYKLYAQNGYESLPCHIRVPFEPIVIPEGATSVTFEIRWDLTNIIQQYMGRASGTPWTVDTVANDENDIFVLRNKFWEGFSITATVN